MRALLAGSLVLAVLLASGPALAHSVAGPESGSTPEPTAIAPVVRPVAQPPDPRLGPAPVIEAGWAEWAPLAVLGLVLVGRGLGRSPRVRRRATAAVTATGLLLVLVEGAPHLVHHLFDADQGADCASLQAAQGEGAWGVPEGPEVGPSAMPTTETVTLAPARVWQPLAHGRAPPA
jgi:hypothetical protein